MSSGNFTASYTETFHHYLIEEFHSYRKYKNLPINFIIDGKLFNDIVVNAKRRLYKERPEAKEAGFSLNKKSFDWGS